MNYFKQKFSKWSDFFKDKESNESHLVLNAKIPKLTRKAIGLNKEKKAPNLVYTGYGTTGYNPVIRI